MFPWESWEAGSRWATKSKGVGLIVRAISFQAFQPMWSWSTNVTDGRTDGQMTCDRYTALCSIVHRAVKAEPDSKTPKWNNNSSPKNYGIKHYRNLVKSTVLRVRLEDRKLLTNGVRQTVPHINNSRLHEKKYSDFTASRFIQLIRMTSRGGHV